MEFIRDYTPQDKHSPPVMPYSAGLKTWISFMLKRRWSISLWI